MKYNHTVVVNEQKNISHNGSNWNRMRMQTNERENVNILYHIKRELTY